MTAVYTSEKIKRWKWKKQKQQFLTQFEVQEYFKYETHTQTHSLSI